MAGMIVQHNLNAINANNKLGINVLGTKKSTEKLSSGFRINRAADDAAGLAISEKMRAQIKGLGAAIRNANDGISLIQTAEGALDETHGMLKRLKELAVLAGNDTYSNEERDYMQMEIDEIKNEIDRIAKATDFNGIKLLDGSLSGMSAASTTFGPRYALYLSDHVTLNGETAADSTDPSILDGKNLTLEGAIITSNIAGVTLSFKNGASGIGGENAEWDESGKILTLNLVKGQAYSQSQIDELIKNANWAKDNEQQYVPAEVTLTLKYGVLSFEDEVDFTTQTGKLAASGESLIDVKGNLAKYLVGSSGSTEKYADTIRFIANNYGVDTRKISILTDVAKGDEWVQTADAKNEAQGIKNGEFVLHLSTGVDYTASDISKILAKAGLDYTVELDSSNAVNGPDGDIVFRANTKIALSEASYDFTGDDFAGSALETALGDLVTTVAAALTGAFGGAALTGGLSRQDLIKAALVSVAAATIGGGLKKTDAEHIAEILANNFYNDILSWLKDNDLDWLSLNSADVAGAALAAVAVAGGKWDVANAVSDAWAGVSGLVLGDVLDMSTVKGAGVGADKKLGSGDGLTFQIGANNASEQRVTLNVDAMDSSAIGIANINVSTTERARESMDKIGAAITAVSRQRASLGAMQNRLEHTINSLTVTTENITAAEAQIRDTDMATEMVEYTKYSILQQAAQAMLAQANQAPQAILQLLR
ncbi:MAG: flagellar hook protein [Oscillospiraceae bacterium]|nr:flagellar hook protein [Oscillospiraceae bacterium]